MDESGPVFPGPFIPARHDPKQTPAPTKTLVNPIVELFEDVSDPELRRNFMEHYHERGGFIDSNTFAILDERSVQDKTVVIHFRNEEMDDDTLEETGLTWYSWRIRFGDAEEMTCALEETLDMFEDVFQQSAAFTGENGIFDFQGAQEAWKSG
jgi:hypothetical protein